MSHLLMVFACAWKIAIPTIWYAYVESLDHRKPCWKWWRDTSQLVSINEIYGSIATHQPPIKQQSTICQCITARNRYDAANKLFMADLIIWNQGWAWMYVDLWLLLATTHQEQLGGTWRSRTMQEPRFLSFKTVVEFVLFWFYLPFSFLSAPYLWGLLLN